MLIYCSFHFSGKEKSTLITSLEVSDCHRQGQLSVFIHCYCYLHKPLLIIYILMSFYFTDTKIISKHIQWEGVSIAYWVFLLGTSNLTLQYIFANLQHVIKYIFVAIAINIRNWWLSTLLWDFISTSTN